jgi:hypothetical protein
MHENKSEVARFREQQALEEQAAHLGLSGFAITARHDFIEARAQRGAEHILRLLAEGKEAEALMLMNAPHWGLEAEEQRYSKKKSGKRGKRRS